MGIACVYCEYKQQQQQTPSNLVASMWRQLCQHKHTLPEAAETLYNDHLQHRVNLSLTKVEALTVEVIEKHSRVLIVVDALDECTEEGLTRANFVGALQILLSGHPSIEDKLQVMITSRQTERLVEGGDDIEIYATEDDLRKLVKRRIVIGISRNRVLTEMIRSNEKLAEELTDNIVSGGEKMYESYAPLDPLAANLACRFLLVRLHLNALHSKTNLRDFRAATKKLPKSLEQVYYDIWLRLNAQDDHLMYLARSVLCWIWCASRQLTVKELQHALATRPGDTTLDEDGIESEDTCLSCCLGLVAVDSGSQIIRLVHKSAQEYFDQRGSDFFPDAHRGSAETCLTYLMYEDFRREPRGEYDWPKGDKTMDKSGLWVLETTTDDEAIERAGELTAALLQRNPFLKYASTFWGRHARGRAEELLQDMILHFVQNAAALANSVKATYNEGEDGLYLKLFFNGRLLGRQVPLFVATYFGLEKIVEELLAIPSIASSDGIDQSVLAWAIRCRQERVARLFIESGANLHGVFDNESVLSLAIGNGFHDISKDLLQEHGASLIGSCELRAAVRLDCAYVVQVYLQTAPDIMSKKTWCNELLSMVATAAVPGWENFIAAVAGRDPYRPAQVLDLVLAEGGGIEATDDQGLTVLQRCIMFGNNPVGRNTIQRLLDRHANIAVLNKDQQSVLHLAAYLEYKDAIWVLLQNGQGVLDINAYDKDGMTPLHYAAASGNAQCTFALLEAGADATLSTKPNRQSVLHLAATSHSNFRMADFGALAVLLFRPPANLNVNARCSRGARPLHYAAEQKDLEAMRLLVLRGADLKARDREGRTGLQLSANLVPLIQQALDKGQDVTSKIHRHFTLWHLLTLMHTRAKIIKRIEELETMDLEDLPRVAKDRKYCVRHLGEIDQRLDNEFAGYDLTEYRDSAQQLAQEHDLDYALLREYNMKRSWESGWERMAKYLSTQAQRLLEDTSPNWLQDASSAN